jgi:hypothetical protein
MDNPGIQLFINVCIALIVLIFAKIALKEWDRRAKAKEAEAAKAASTSNKKKK